VSQPATTKLGTIHVKHLDASLLTSDIRFEQLSQDQARKLEDFEMLQGMLIARLPYRDDHYYRVLTKPTAGFVHYIEFLEDGTRWVKNGAITKLSEGLDKLLKKGDYEVSEIFYAPIVPIAFRTLFDFNLGRKDGSPEEDQRRLFLQGLNQFIDAPGSFDPFDL
jgi:hypothetical protein